MKSQQVWLRKALYHSSTTLNPLRPDAHKWKGDGFHAGTIRAALDRASEIHAADEFHQGGKSCKKDHYLTKVRTRVKAFGTMADPHKDVGHGWKGLAPTIYENAYEHQGSRSLYTPNPKGVKRERTIEIPHDMVANHKNGYGQFDSCGPKCVHERALTALVRR